MLDSHNVSRREFGRRAALTGLVTAVSGIAYLGWRERPLAAQETQSVPPFTHGGQVVDMAPTKDSLVALFAESQGYTIWTFQFGSAAWTKTTEAQAFPSNSILRGIAVVDDLLLIAGATVVTVRMMPIVDDDGVESVLRIESSLPLILSSKDGQGWGPAADIAADASFGAFCAITSSTDRSEVLAVGSSYPEESVHEPGAIIAASSRDGVSWKSLDLRGVPTPNEGSVTMLAHGDQELLLGVAETGGSHLYAATALGSDWRRIAAPEGSSSYIAAGADGRGQVLLAGVDEQDAPHLWRDNQGSWEELPLEANERVVDMEEIDGELIAAISTAEGSSITDLGDEAAVTIARDQEFSSTSPEKADAQEGMHLVSHDNM